MGLAAPQINIGLAAAVVRTPEGEMVTLLNPRINDESAQTDEQYEGCLSFFDVRGMVARPLAIDVEHPGIDGWLWPGSAPTSPRWGVGEDPLGRDILAARPARAAGYTKCSWVWSGSWSTS